MNRRSLLTGAASRRPSPAMVVAVLALVMAMAGTGIAASGILISRSSQIAPRVIQGRNIAGNTITAANLARSAVNTSKLEPGLRDLILTGARNGASSTGGFGGATAREVFRRDGPSNQPAGQTVTVATMPALAPGVYAIFAKSVLAANFNNQTDATTLFARLQSGGDAEAKCTLDAAGDQDVSFTPVATPFASTASNVTLQITRTLSQPGNVTLSCGSSLMPWGASNTTIIAVKVADAPRVPVGG